MGCEKSVGSEAAVSDAGVFAPLGFADYLQDIVARFDPELRHTYVNKAIQRVTGLGPEKFLGKTNRELGMPAELVECWDKALAEVFRTGLPAEIRFSFDSPYGKREFAGFLTPYSDASGCVTSVISVARDTTSSPDPALEPPVAQAQSSAADALPDLAPGSFSALQSEIVDGHFKSIVESSDDAVISKTLDGLVTSWSRGAEILFGYTKEEMLGQSMQKLFPPDKKNEEQFILERLIEGERVEHFETVRVRKGGGTVYVSVNISPIRDRQGKIVGASKIARDITALRLQQERLQMVLEATRNGMWDWDLRTGKVYRTNQYYALTGYFSDDDIQDFAFFKRTVHPDDLPHVLEAIHAHRRGETSHIEYEYRLMGKTGETGKWMQVKGRVIERDGQGKPVRILGTLCDITSQKLTEMALRQRERQLQRVIDGSDQGYWDWNLLTNAIHVSAKWKSMLGYATTNSDPTEENALDLDYVHPEDVPRVYDALHRHLRGQALDYNVEMRCRSHSGDWRWILTKGRIVEWTPDGVPMMLSGTRTDITERKNMELAQQEANTVFMSSYEGILVVNTDKTIIRVNPSFTRITGYSAEEAVGERASILSSGSYDPAFYAEIWRAVELNQFWSGEIWNRRKSGEVYAEHLSISAVRDSAGKVQHYVGVFSDISGLKAHEAELDRVAHHDYLTGLPNRRLLADRLEQAILRTNRSDNLLAVCYLDLDGFKAINDAHGHAAGDKLLIGVTEHLKQVLRVEDTLARLGGDEFVLLLSDIPSHQECVVVLQRILQAVNLPVLLGGQWASVGASMGVSLYPADHVDADTLMRHADQAMYRAKEAGKNRFHLFDPSNDRKA